MPPTDDQNLGADQTDNQSVNQQASGLQPGSSFNPQAQPQIDDAQSVGLNSYNTQQDLPNSEPVMPSIDSITGVNPANQTSDVAGDGSVGQVAANIPQEPIQSQTAGASTNLSNDEIPPQQPLAQPVFDQPGVADTSQVATQNQMDANLVQQDNTSMPSEAPIQAASVSPFGQSVSDNSMSQGASTDLPTGDIEPVTPANNSDLAPLQPDNQFQPSELQTPQVANPEITAEPTMSNPQQTMLATPDNSPTPTDFYAQSQGNAVGQDGGMIPPNENFDTNQPEYTPPSSSSGSKMVIALVVIGIAILALAAGLGYVLTRKKAQPASTQPVQTQQPKAEEVTIEFNQEITVPTGYVLVENDCYKTIVVQENALKKADNCNLSGTYGKKALSSLSIADSTKLISTDDIKNSTADKIKQAINSAQTASGVTIDVVSIESIKLGQADAVKVIYNMTSANKTTKMVDVFAIAPKDRYKTSAGATIESFVLSGSYGDSFSQENFDKIINNWSWK
jgi:hypothetical protein